jgi:hypothetical protein
MANKVAKYRNINFEACKNQRAEPIQFTTRFSSKSRQLSVTHIISFGFDLEFVVLGQSNMAALG